MSDDRDVVVTLTESQARFLLAEMRSVLNVREDGMRQDAARVAKKLEKALADREAKRRTESATAAALKRTLDKARRDL
jgi:predicted DNA-binding transcriptional regulator YafY